MADISWNHSQFWLLESKQAKQNPHERYFQAAWNGSFTAVSDDGHGILYYDGLIDPGAFELLLGGVSRITHKASVLIAALSAGPSASRWW